MVSSVVLARWFLGKVFKPARKVFKLELIHILFSIMETYLIFYTLVLLIHYLFSYFILFSTSRCLRLVLFMVYSVHSLSIWYTHSPTFLPFKLGTITTSTALAPRNCGGNLSFFLDIGGYFILDIHWAYLIWWFHMFCIISFGFITIFMWYILCQERMLMIWFWSRFLISRKGFVLFYGYKLFSWQGFLSVL